MELRFESDLAEPLWSCELHFLEDCDENKRGQFGQDGVDRNMRALGEAIRKRLATVSLTEVSHSLLCWS